jgi:superfamily II DNA or RNA helicase
MIMSTFVPSEEQAAIFDAVLNTSDNVAIRALAGTGKTTTLVELAKKLPKHGSKLFCAFNKDIVAELQKRL